MAQSQTTARTRRLERERRYRERSPGLATGLSILTFFLVGLIIFTIEVNAPPNPLHYLFRLIAYGQTSAASPLYQRLMGQVEREEVFFVTPFSLLCAGIALGRLMPRRIARPRLIRIAAGVSVGVLLICIAFKWIIILYGQHWRLQPGEVNFELAKVQTLCFIGWLIAYLIGVLAGVFWRDRTTRPAPMDDSA